jgi:hypothetical protein
MTIGDLKTGRSGSRTPFQILADYYETGEILDRNLWREYARVTRSHAAVRWSRGLRTAVLGATAEPERVDQELAVGDTNGQLVASMAVQVWWQCPTVRTGPRHACCCRARRSRRTYVNVDHSSTLESDP